MPGRQPPEQYSFEGMGDGKASRRLLFLIWPDALAIDQLMKLTKRLVREGTKPCRPVKAHRLHVTLQIIGVFADQMPASLIPLASRAAAKIRTEPFEITFDRHVGTGGNLLLRPSGRLEALMKFQRILTFALRRAGIKPILKVTFRPHVTLSYDPSDVPEQTTDPISRTVREFALIESLIGKHEHIVLGRWQLMH